jgi:uncharacterized protein
MKCPVCVEVDLKIADRQGVEIDYCPRCRGVWLDRGELDKIISRASTYSSMPPAAQTVRDAAKRKNDYFDDDYTDQYEIRRNRREDDRYERRPSDRENDKRRRKNFLDEIFDIFD